MKILGCRRAHKTGDLRHGEAAIAPRHDLGPITQDSPADMPRGFIHSPSHGGTRGDRDASTIPGARLRGMGMRGRIDTGPQESVRQAGLKKASVKPVHEFSEIEWTPGAAAPVMGPINECFRQTDDRVHSMKDLGSLRIPTEGDSVIGLMSFRSRSINVRSIAEPDPIRVDPPLQDLQHCLFLHDSTTSKKAYCGWMCSVKLTPTITGSWSVPRPRLPGP